MLMKKEYENFTTILLRAICILLMSVGLIVAITVTLWRLLTFPDNYNSSFTESGKTINSLMAFFGLLSGTFSIFGLLIGYASSYISRKICHYLIAN